MPKRPAVEPFSIMSPLVVCRLYAGPLNEELTAHSDASTMKSSLVTDEPFKTVEYSRCF